MHSYKTLLSALLLGCCKAGFLSDSSPLARGRLGGGWSRLSSATIQPPSNSQKGGEPHFKFMGYRTLGIVVVLFIATALMAAPLQEGSESKVTAADSRFAFKMLSKLNDQAQGANVFFSPAGVSWCLSMVWNGAQGKTREEMTSALEFNGLGPEDINRSYMDWRNSYGKPDANVTLQIANSIWARRGLGFRPEFLQINQRFFQAEVSELNFSDPASVNTINGWVQSKTNGKIDRIIDSIDSSSAMFLINAIYFNGKWTHQFNAAQTTQDAFTTAANAKKRVPMMRRHGTFKYFEQPEFQAVSLPYGDGRLSLYLFLPAQKISLAQLHQSLTFDNWKDWMKHFEDTEGDLALPRFKITYEATLNDALKALGMQSAFSPDQANLGAMLQNSRNAYISKVKHKAFIDLNEQGTEAAAATSTEIQIVSMPVPSHTFHMVVDRPFFFAIRDNLSGSLLFLGSIKDPA